MRSLLLFPCHGINGRQLNRLGGRRLSDTTFLADELEFVLGDVFCASFWGGLYLFDDSDWLWLEFLDLCDEKKNEIIMIKGA